MKSVSDKVFWEGHLQRCAALSKSANVVEMLLDDFEQFKEIRTGKKVFDDRLYCQCGRAWPNSKINVEEHELVCDCGRVDVQNVPTEGIRFVSWNDLQSTTITYRGYNKLSNFRNYLRQLKGASKKGVPSLRAIEAVGEVVSELGSRLILANLSERIVREILRRNHLGKQYRYCGLIVKHFNPSYQLFSLDHDRHKQFEQCFKTFETIWKKSADVISRRYNIKRKNFMPCALLAYRFAHFMQWHDLLPYFRIITTARLRKIQDAYFLECAKHVGWKNLQPVDVLLRGINFSQAVVQGKHGTSRE